MFKNLFCSLLCVLGIAACGSSSGGSDNPSKPITDNKPTVEQPAQPTTQNKPQTETPAQPEPEVKPQPETPAQPEPEVKPQPELPAQPEPEVKPQPETPAQPEPKPEPIDETMLKVEGTPSHTENADASYDYRRVYKDVVANKSAIAIQTIRGPQAGASSRGEKQMAIKLNGNTYDMTDRIDISALPDGQLMLKYDARGKELKVGFPDNRIVDTHERGTMHIYQQPYSAVIATAPTEFEYDGKTDPEGRLGKADSFQVQLVSGLATSAQTVTNLTEKGVTANYKGKAFTDLGNGVETGQLDYAIDFGAKKGKGEITGIESTGRIELTEGRIGGAMSSQFNPMSTAERGKGISSSVNAEKMDAYYYELSIFGPKAEEIAGYVYGRKQGKEGKWNVAFAGSQAEVAKAETAADK